MFATTDLVIPYFKIPNNYDSQI